MQEPTEWVLFLAKGFKEIRSKAAKINDAYASPSRSSSGWQEHERLTLVDYSAFEQYYTIKWRNAHAL